METFQRFRLAGTTAVKKIPYERVGEHNVIFWEDIKERFPGIEQVECDGVLVNLMRDSNHQR